MKIAKGTRDNPYSKGINFVLEGENRWDGHMKFELELLETKRGQQAYQFLVEEDEVFPDKKILRRPDKRLKKAKIQGKEIFLVKLYAKALKLEEQPFDINPVSLFELMDSTGTVYDIESAMDTNNPFREPDKVYEGGEITGWLTFLVPKGDSPLILITVSGETAFVDPEVGESRKLINLTLNKKKHDELAKQAKSKGISMQEYLIKIIE